MRQILQDILNMLLEFFQLEVQAKEPAPVHNRNERLMVFASGEIGQKEIKGKADNPQIRKYHAYAAPNNDQEMADEVPWCASFVCYCLEMVGMGSTNSRMARSFLKWGVSTKSNPMPGDLVVYWRGSKTGWQGHVGIYLGHKNGLIYTLGGNQADAVSITKYSQDKVLDYRRSSKMEALTPEKVTRLNNLASKIISGEKVSLNASVV